jgi:hypothetical protein
MTDLTAGELTKTFVKAVNESFAQDRTKEAEFLLNGTLDEVLTVLGAWIGPNDKPYSSEDQIPADTLLYIADVYAKIAEQTGQSETYEKFVPAGTVVAEDRATLTEQAPAFAKLAL